MTLGVSYGSTLGDAPGVGGGVPVFRDELSAKESREILTLSYARLIDRDRLQAGVSAPFVFNSVQNAGKNASSGRLGDVSFNLAYETMPEWEYSVWKPRVFTFLQATVASARSIYESENLLASDVGGLGQFQTAMGMVATKRASNWDASTFAKVARIYGRTFESPLASKVKVGPSWGLSASLGGGYSFADRVRLGLSVTPEYQTSNEVSSDASVRLTSPKLVWNSGLTLTYLAGLNDSVILSLNDQSLLGPAINTALIRTAAVAFTHRIER